MKFPCNVFCDDKTISFLCSMSTGRVPLTNVCHSVAEGQTDFEQSRSSGDEWMPPVDEEDNDKEEQCCGTIAK